MTKSRCHWCPSSPAVAQCPRRRAADSATPAAHPGQAGIHHRVYWANLSNQRAASSFGDVGAAIRRRPAGASRCQPARHYRHRRIAAVDRQFDYEQEAAEVRRHCARRQGWFRGLHEVSSAGANLRTPWSNRARHGVPHPCPADGDELPAGSNHRRSRWPRRWRCWPAADRPTWWSWTLRLAGEMLELAGIHGRDPAPTLRDAPQWTGFRRLVAAQEVTCRNRCRSVRIFETVTAGERHNGRYRCGWQWG